MEDGIANDHIRAAIFEGQIFDRSEPEVRLRKGWRELPGERTNAIDGLLVRVRGVHLITFSQEVDDVASRAAAGIEDSHSRCDTALQQLVEKIDVDLAELLFKRGHKC